MIKFLLLYLFTLSSYSLVEDENLIENYGEIILKNYFSIDYSELEISEFKKIKYKYFNFNKKKNLIIFPGQGEASIKYSEVIYDLKEHFNILIINHRGQGNSFRFTEEKEISIVDDFKNYALDARKILEKENLLNSNSNFLFAHSMGALIGIIYLSTFPNDFKKVVFSAPMIKINYGWFPEFLIKFLARVFSAISPHSYVFGQGGYPWNEKFKDNKLSTSKKRWTNFREVIKKYKNYACGGISFRWLQSVIDYTTDAKIKEYTKKIKIDSMILRPLEDEIVTLEDQKSFCDNLKNCELIDFENSRHEVLQEVDIIRNIGLEKIINFLN